MSEEQPNPIILNAEELRASMLLNIFAGNPLYGLDEEYAFFYDETNNIRKFWIRDDGFNEQPKNFVLGGIAHKKSEPLTGLDELVKSLHIQKSAKEIKFNQLATGSYLGVLNSRKIRTLLEWLSANGVFIHYTNFNILYWSLVDIVDSLWDEPELRQYMPYVMHIKGELFNLANADLDRLVPILKKYRFPNVQRNASFSFMTEFSDLLESVSKKPQSDISELVIYMVRKAANLPELPFIVDNEDDVLIDSFDSLFLRPLYIYPTSSHTFDNETEVQEALGNTQIGYKGRFVEYSFVDSRDCIEIQLSDGICGLLGSHFNFLEEHSVEELIEIKKNLNPVQRQTLSLLRKLIDISDTQSNGFMYRISPMDSDYKNDYFLHDRTLPDHLV
ncbi:MULTISPECIES: DUF3800 domain-containing protein [Gammaproteobacteria]|uniref:Uncharacterized protein n=1 Tax=Congregibacter litoralis KT71 TaxID=314285 RepID=A4AAI5_9GAMM|nr:MULTISPECIES: DUF3800 domain-containing protein [Gammaproteobacteria]EAQ97062.1 hypothetical protein KT71_12405 [Congregibacter litoralis KT71]HEH9395038.1 DUF3800 domain-containing protein [Aeromonas salmonicida]